MAGYEEARYAEWVSFAREAIEDFASQYGANPTLNDRRTVFLFPGGLGSRLMRSNWPHPSVPLYYEMSWLDCGVLTGDALDLKMLPGDIDFEEKYVVPKGYVDFIARPYDGFVQWCRNNWIDVFVFGWDWRRSAHVSANFFLTTFMPMFDSRFMGQTPHPLDNFTLIGHSAGGMVVKRMLDAAANQYVQRARKAITVATPFYGYGGQVHRFLKGDPDLNWTDPQNGASRYTRAISSLPGVYEYLFLDHDTYQANKVALESDPENFNLAAYPSLDKDDPTEVADPYDPQPDNQGRVRYPLNYGFETSLLSRGKLESRNISRAIADRSVAAKLYNIRGVQFKNGVTLNETVVSQKWKRVSASFDPDTDPDPIEDEMGPGDGTQPAWTTRLLGLPDPGQQVITIRDDIEHQKMMNHPSVQAKIAELLGLDPNFMVFAPEESEFAASRLELNKFRDAAQELMARELTLERRRIVLAEYLRQFKPSQLHKLFARAYIDALKSPSQKSSAPKAPKRPSRR